MIMDGIKSSGEDYKKAAQAVIDKHVAESSHPYTGDDTTLILLDIGLPGVGLMGGALTRKAKKRRLKKQTKRLNPQEGLKTITI